MADAETIRLLTSTPFTMSVGPLVPMAVASRKRVMVARMSWSKTGRFSIAFASTLDASRFDAVSAVISAGAFPTVTSWLIAASGSVTRNGAGAPGPTGTRTVVGRNPSKVATTSYRPGVTLSNRKAPAGSAVVDRTGAPADGFSSTCAAGSTAPVRSKTVPVTG